MIKLNREVFTKALERAAKVSSAKPSLKAFSHVAISFDGKRLEYRALDERISLVGNLEADGKPASFTANARDLLSTVQALEGPELKLDVATGHVKVSASGKRSFKVKTLDHADFPAAKTQPDERITLPTSVVQTIERVMYAAAPDNEDREHLKAVRVVVESGSLTVTTTDGKRLARCSMPIESPDMAISLPVAAARLIPAFIGDGATFEIAHAGDDIWFWFNGEALCSRANSQDFPPVKFMFDARPGNTVALNGSDLANAITAVRRADKDGDIIVTLSGSSIRIEAVGDGYGVDEFDAECEPSEFAMSAQYMTDALKAAGEKITMYYGVELDPVFIRADNYDAILMPRRIDTVRSKARL